MHAHNLERKDPMTPARLPIRHRPKHLARTLPTAEHSQRLLARAHTNLMQPSNVLPTTFGVVLERERTPLQHTSTAIRHCSEIHRRPVCTRHAHARRAGHGVGVRPRSGRGEDRVEEVEDLVSVISPDAPHLVIVHLDVGDEHGVGEVAVYFDRVVDLGLGLEGQGGEVDTVVVVCEDYVRESLAFELMSAGSWSRTHVRLALVSLDRVEDYIDRAGEHAALVQAGVVAALDGVPGIRGPQHSDSRLATVAHAVGEQQPVLALEQLVD